MSGAVGSEPDHLHFGDEVHAGRLTHPGSHPVNEAGHVVGRATVVALYEVGMLGRNLGRAEALPLETAGVDQSAGRVTGRVGEHGTGV